MKCIRCFERNVIGNGKICYPCLNKFTKMREIIFNALQTKYGTMNKENHDVFKKETKRLENIWRKDEQKFLVEIELINK